MPLIVTGVKETQRAIGAAVRVDAVRIADGLLILGERILRRATKYVPKDTLALKETGRVEVKGRGFGARVTVEYGGIAPNGTIVDYAAVVHNDLEAHHQPPTQALYLSRATKELAREGTKIVGRKLSTTGVEGVEGMNRTGGFNGQRGMRS